MLCERILQLGALSTSCSWWYTLSFFLVMPINEIYYNDAIMSVIASQITKLTIAYSTVYSGADQRNHQSSVSLAFVLPAPVTGEFPTQMSSNAENVSIW